jgi:hypothetical protein
VYIKKALIAFTLTVAALLLLTNPDIGAFQEYTKYLICDHGAPGPPVPLYQKHNFFFFSTYGGTTRCLNGENKPLHYVGIAGYFFEYKGCE